MHSYQMHRQKNLLAEERPIHLSNEASIGPGYLHMNLNLRCIQRSWQAQRQCGGLGTTLIHSRNNTCMRKA